MVIVRLVGMMGDGISNEMLKHASVKFRHYLLKFLTKIIMTGIVPSDMNMLITFDMSVFTVQSQSTRT